MAKIEDLPECPICYEPSADFLRTPCNHHICMKCGVRYKYVCKKTNCPVCLGERGESVLFAAADAQRACEAADREYEAKMKNRYRELESLSVPLKRQWEAIERMVEKRCKLCKKTFSATEDMQKHYKSVHNKRMCDLCLAHRYELPSEWTVYTEALLKRHVNEEEGHPLCLFCDTRFYSKDILVKHCRKTHELCYVCERLGKKNEYYKNYAELEAHFRKAHYVCNEPLCAETKCNVFTDEIELVAHQIQLHSFTKKTPLRVSYIRPSGRRGEQGEKGDAEHTAGKADMRRGQGEERGGSAGRDAERRAVPQYLDRTEIQKTRAIQSLVPAFIAKNFKEWQEPLEESTTAYEQSRTSLDSFVKSVTKTLGSRCTLDFLSRIKSYLPASKKTEIEKNLGRIKDEIDFPPFIPAPRPPLAERKSEKKEGKRIGYKLFVFKK